MSNALMVQGTTSDAGKSTLVAGLCRALRRQGVRVAPFKPQNMALNSAVTIDGGEIGRAQAVQARAAGLRPHSDMNPVLLKPSADHEAQVIVHGRVLGTMDARAYHAYKPVAMEAVLDSFDRLSRQFDVVVVEGAGSPAEINLREGDIANMGFALAALCPVVLMADIDRGGALAHLVGTLELLSRDERALVRGFVINRFRGDRTLLDPGLEWLEARTGKPVHGVIPYLHGLTLDAEDAIDQDQRAPAHHALRVAAPVYPRISNHTDFDALRARRDVDLRFVGPGQSIRDVDLVVLAGSKNVRADLDFIRRQGWDVQIRRHLRYGGKLIGICGGMQMLGTSVSDSLGLEGPPGTTRGLDLLDFETLLEPEKTLRDVQGALCLPGHAPVRGYEMHMGVSRGKALSSPAVNLAGHGDGAISEDGRILCTYVHGLFDAPEACAALLEWAGARGAPLFDHAAERERSLERLADAVCEHIDLSRLLSDLDVSDKRQLHALRAHTREGTTT